MSEVDKIINDAFYIDNIFEHIKMIWPDLHDFIINEESRTRLYYRNYLVKTINYDGVNTFDGIIKHIDKNKELHAWWIL